MEKSNEKEERDETESEKEHSNGRNESNVSREGPILTNETAQRKYCPGKVSEAETFDDCKDTSAAVMGDVDIESQRLTKRSFFRAITQLGNDLLSQNYSKHRIFNRHQPNQGREYLSSSYNTTSDVRGETKGVPLGMPMFQGHHTPQQLTANISMAGQCQAQYRWNSLKKCGWQFSALEITHRHLPTDEC